ncbi:hypothetical protein C2G38_2096617, partial [Gigaspora rosea]
AISDCSTTSANKSNSGGRPRKEVWDTYNIGEKIGEYYSPMIVLLVPQDKINNRNNNYQRASNTKTKHHKSKYPADTNNSELISINHQNSLDRIKMVSIVPFQTVCERNFSILIWFYELELYEKDLTEKELQACTNIATILINLSSELIY